MAVRYTPVMVRNQAAIALLSAYSLLACAGLPHVTSEAPADATIPEPDWAGLAAERLPIVEPCELFNAPEKVLCGTLEVWEDRAAAAGRKISLEIVVVPAKSVDPPPDAVFVFEGGPGGAATQRALGSIYSGPVRARDIVLVDQRGTGGSNPLRCDWDPEFREGELREMYPVADVEACAAEIAVQVDTRLYTSAHFADDIEEVRRALGYGSINVRGGSYGTAAMMVYAQRHPESVRSLFGIGWTSPLRSNLAERGIWTDRTIERLAAMCAADLACAAIAPDLEAMLVEVLARLEAGPQRVELPDPAAPETTLALDLGHDWLTEQLRLVLYFAFTSQGLPWAVHRAHETDDWAPLATLAVTIERSFRAALATGLALTIQCSEGMDFDVAAALARGADTLVGNYRLEQQLQGCAHWPHERVPGTGVADPKVLDAPTLMLSGALDPVTPPEYAEDARTLLPNSLHLVLPEGQHGPFDLENSWECVHDIWADFLDRGSVEGVDTSCTESMTRPPFVTDAAGFDGYVAETLIPFSS